MRKRSAPPLRRPVGPQPPAGILELDRFSEQSIRRWLELSKDLDELEAVLFFALVPERRRVKEALTAALDQANRPPLEFEQWYRTVTFQYSHSPLSCAGSMLGIGGRFSAGADLDDNTLAPWPALYIAQDHETAFREKYQLPSTAKREGLSPEDLALQTVGSHSSLRVRGRLHRVFDMTRPELLAPVSRVLAGIKMPQRAQALKKKLKASSTRMVGSPADLWRAVLEYNWRQLPVQFGLPSQSQIFAQIVRDAGYEAILYPSTKSSGLCLAVFADRLQDASHVELQDPSPAYVEWPRLDSTTAIHLAGFECLPSQARRLALGA